MWEWASLRAWVQWEAVREGCVCVCVCVCVLGREARHRECFESRNSQLSASVPRRLYYPGSPVGSQYFQGPQGALCPGGT